MVCSTRRLGSFCRVGSADASPRSSIHDFGVSRQAVTSPNLLAAPEYAELTVPTTPLFATRLLLFLLCVAPLLRPARAEEPVAPQVTRGTVQFQPAAGEDTRPALFRLSPHEFPCQETTRKRSWAQIVRQIEVTFPSPVQTEHENNNTVHAEYFLPSGSGTHPGVIVLHILGGDFELSRLCCRTLAINGVAPSLSRCRTTARDDRRVLMCG